MRHAWLRCAGSNWRLLAGLQCTLLTRISRSLPRPHRERAPVAPAEFHGARAIDDAWPPASRRTPVHVHICEREEGLDRGEGDPARYPSASKRRNRWLETDPRSGAIKSPGRW